MADEDDGTDHDPAIVKIVLKLASDRGVISVEALHNKTVVGRARIDYAKSSIRRVAQSAGVL